MTVGCRAPAHLAPAACPPCPPPRSSRGVARGSCRCCSIPCRADVLLIDAQNVLSRAHADHRRGCRLPGESAAGSFADWLQFLAALAQPQLMVAVFDAPRARRPAQQQRDRLAPEYLQRRRRRQHAPPPTSSGSTSAAAGGGGGGDPLRPFKEQVAQLGGVSLEAAGGWEADDGLAAACVAVQRRHPAARLLLASGDGDMQQLLAPQTAWLQLHGQTSLACPLGAQLVTAATFEQQHGFPPAAYPDWLSFAGKKEASIKGADVAASTAAKLLARYGSLEGVLEAAAAGQLKGWGPAVQQLLAGGSSSSRSSGTSNGGIGEERKAHLRRNRQLFALSAHPAAVQPAGMSRLAAALERIEPAAAAAAASAEAGHWDCSSNGDSSSSGGGGGAASIVPASAELAWRHPLHARRRRHLQQLAVGGAAGGDPSRGQARQQAVTSQGLAVDHLCCDAGASSAGPTSSSGSSTAVFHVCPCDVTAGSWPRALTLAGGAGKGKGGGVEGDHTAALLPLLHGAMRHHIKLVQRAGYRVALTLAPHSLDGLG